MPIEIAITKETAPHETRVAATPDTVKALSAMNCHILIETNAGLSAGFNDSEYEKHGATICKTAAETHKSADIILKVQINAEDNISNIKEGAILIGLCNPHSNLALIKELASKRIETFSMEFIPRISRAQSMDALSSQANLAGYKSILDAAAHFKRAFPMMMTAAGTVAPAKVLVMGAGVAGLQAIATAKRLGAVVSATDVRPAAKEQVQSLGGKFIAVEDDEFKEAETSGGYAKEMSDEYKKKQATLIEETIKKQDIVITTALIPGRPAPKLISSSMIKSMRLGSVIVDMATITGGNVEGSKQDKVVEKNGVTILGYSNIPARLPTDSSTLYSKNLLNLIKLIINQENKSLEINWDDEIVKGIVLTKGGEVIHPALTQKKD